MPKKELSRWGTMRHAVESNKSIVDIIDPKIIKIERILKLTLGINNAQLSALEREYRKFIELKGCSQDQLSNFQTSLSIPRLRKIHHHLLQRLIKLQDDKQELMALEKLRTLLARGNFQLPDLYSNDFAEEIHDIRRMIESRENLPISIQKLILRKCLKFFGRKRLADGAKHELVFDDIEPFVEFGPIPDDLSHGAITSIEVQFSSFPSEKDLVGVPIHTSVKGRERLLAPEWMYLAKQQAGVPWLITISATLLREQWVRLSESVSVLFSLNPEESELPLHIYDLESGMHIYFWIRRDSVIEDIISLGELLRDFSKANIVKHIIPAPAPTSEAREEDGINSLGYNYAQQLRQHRLIRDLSQMFVRVNHSINHADHPNSITLKTDTGAKMQILFSKIEGNVNLDEIHNRIFGCKKPVKLEDDYTIRRSRGTANVSKHRFNPEK